MPFKNDVKKSTLEIYEKNYNKLSRDLNGGEIDDDFRWLLSFEKIMEEINKSPSLHTKKNKINSVLIYLNMIPDLKKEDEEIIKKYNNEIVKLSKLIKADYNTNTKNEKQEKNWMTTEELKKLTDTIKAELPKTFTQYPNYKKLMHYLMLSLHLELPIRNDMADAQLYSEKDFNKIEESTDINYLVLGGKEGYLILNNYKTSSSYGRKKINLSPNLFSIFKKYMPIILEQSKDKYIFIDKEGIKLSRNRYTLLFNNLFTSLGIDKKISTSLIRHIVISEKFPVNKNEMQEKENLAYIMGHSVNEASSVYSKATN